MSTVKVVTKAMKVRVRFSSGREAILDVQLLPTFQQWAAQTLRNNWEVGANYAMNLREVEFIELLDESEGMRDEQRP